MRSLNYLFAFFAVTLLLFNACKKVDNTAPIITLIGDDSISAGIGTPYLELGAIAEDTEDGKLVPLIEPFPSNQGYVNTNVAKTYTLSYTAWDLSGNKSIAYRYITVKNLSSYLAGTWTNTHKIGYDTLTGLPTDSADYSQIISASTSINNRISFSKFANITFAPNSTKINADIAADNSITIPLQSANIVLVKHYYRGFGSVVNSKLIELTYFDSLPNPNLKAKKYTLKIQRL